MLLTELNPYFQLAMRKELRSGEELVWWAQPDPDAVARSLLPLSVIWLSGLFLMAVAMMLNAPGETDSLLGGLVLLLVLVAGVGAFELIIVPRRAERTVYIVTNQRVFTMCVTKKLNQDETEITEKRVLREDPSTVKGFYLANLPAQLLVVLTGSDVVRALNNHFDMFLAAGFGLVLLGWTRPWFSEMRFPFAKFRDAPRVLYAIDDLFIATETLPADRVRQVKLRRLGKDLFNIFFISHASGCVRFRAVIGVDKAKALIECFPGAREAKGGSI